MRLALEDIRRRAAIAKVARVGTIDDRGRVHLVPVVFALEGDTLYSNSDAGPPVKRLRNLERDARVTVLIDEYDEDWSKVWWVRLRGTGRRVEEPGEEGRARALLMAKYPQFAQAPPEEGQGPIMAVDVTDWSGWAYSS